MTKIAHTTWEHDMNHESNGSLLGTIETDVTVIGGGITGLLAAYALLDTGKTVTIIEKDTIGAGATLKTTAFLTEIIDTDYKDICSYQDSAMAALIAQSHREAIDRIEAIIKEEKIDCEWQRVSSYIYANNPKESAVLGKEAAVHEKINIESELKTKLDLGFEHTGVIEVKNQAKFNPGKFTSALVTILRNKGVVVFEQTQADSIVCYGNRKTIHVTSDGTEAKIETEWIVTATYEPFMRPLGLYFKKAFYTSYVYELECPKGALKEGLYEDMENPYHYFRVDHLDDRDRVIVGGEDHRSDLHVPEEKCFKALMKFIKKTFKHIPFAIIHQWKGPILESVDGLAFIGSFRDENMLYALGFSGNGMTYAQISAEIFRDLILGKANPYIELYRADRMPYLRMLMLKGKDYTGELFGGAVKNGLGQSKIVKKMRHILE